MKIVLVCPMPPCATGPGAIPRLLHAQVEGLGARHEVTVVTVAGPDEWELAAVEDLRGQGLDVRAALRTHPRGFDRWRRRGRLAFAWGVRRLPWRTAWFWEPSLQVALDRRLAEGTPDILQAEDNAVALYRFQGARATVLTEYEVRRPRPMRVPRHLSRRAGRELLNEIDWHRWRRYQRESWSKFDRLQVFTEHDAKVIREMAPALGPRVRVNPFGVEIPAPCNPAREQAGSLLFVGNFSHPPNVDAALWLGTQIMPALLSLVPHARLTLVGEQAPAEVRALAGPHIEVVGGVRNTRPWLEQAQVVLAPVRTGGGMRMKVLEAMAAGKAVVTTPRGARGLGADAPLRTAETAATMAAAVAALIDDSDERMAIGAAARSFAIERHSPDVHARRLEDVYRELLEVEPARAPGERPSP